VEHVPCGRLMVGVSADGGGVMLGGAGSKCDGPKPDTAISFNASVAVSRERSRFVARGVDSDGSDIEIAFDIDPNETRVTPPVKGVLRVVKGSRVVVADAATLRALD